MQKELHWDPGQPVDRILRAFFFLPEVGVMVVLSRPGLAVTKRTGLNTFTESTDGHLFSFEVLEFKFRILYMQGKYH